MASEYNSDGFSRKKLIFFSFIITTVALLLVVSLAEITLRFKYRNIENITGITDWKDFDNGVYTYFGDIYHPTRGWTSRPGYHSNISLPYKVSINSQGLRANHDYTLLPAAGTKRLAILGDSFTFGDEVNDDQTLPYYLNHFLDATEVLNFGESGYGLDQMVLRLEEEVFLYHPTHILLVIAIPPDLARAVITEYVHPKPAFAIKNGVLALVNSPVPTHLRQPKIFRLSFAAAWFFGRPGGTTTDDSNEHVLAVSRALLSRAKRSCQEKGIPLIIVPILGPTYARELNDAGNYSSVGEFHDSVRNMMEEEHLVIANQYSFLRGMIKDKNEQELRNLASSTVVHWAGRGNCLLAGNISHDLIGIDSSWQISGTPPHCAPVFPSAAGK
ncbi:MAG: SGNH/GDSL hydrolase family protein [Desulfuromonadales bacterium]